MVNSIGTNRNPLEHTVNVQCHAPQHPRHCRSLYHAVHSAVLSESHRWQKSRTPFSNISQPSRCATLQARQESHTAPCCGPRMRTHHGTAVSCPRLAHTHKPRYSNTCTPLRRALPCLPPHMKHFQPHSESTTPHSAQPLSASSGRRRTTRTERTRFGNS